jgi:hypothetical protein
MQRASMSLDLLSMNTALSAATLTNPEAKR